MFQKELGLLLVKQGLDLDKAAVIVAIFKDDGKLTCEMLVWLYDTKPNEEQIMHWIEEHTYPREPLRASRATPLRLYAATELSRTLMALFKRNRKWKNNAR